MGDWSKAVIDKIAKGGSPGHRQLIDLDAHMDGPTFEQHLGNFLRRAQAFTAVEPFLKPSLDLFDARQELKMIVNQSQSVLDSWYQSTRAGINQLLQWLNETLFELFGSPGINDYAATQAYGWLLRELQITPQSTLVYATTNYDHVGEIALEKLDFLVDWGRPVQVRSSPDVTLRVEKLLAGLGRAIPVLHLHGRLGWFLREDGTVGDMQVDTFSTQWGTPVVMWPDDRKDASSYAATPLW
jgi:hypothetical protein